jgi:hypothetical protein
MNKVKISYFAGLFDGEGSFCIQLQKRNTPNFNPRMSMSLKYGSKVLIQLKKQFGGNIYYYNDNMTRWHLGRKELMIKTIRLMYPYLIIKKQRAKQFLKALNLFPKNRHQKWTVELANKIFDIAKNLNPNDSRKYKIYKDLK